MAYKYNLLELLKIILLAYIHICDRHPEVPRILRSWAELKFSLQACPSGS